MTSESIKATEVTKGMHITCEDDSYGRMTGLIFNTSPCVFETGRTHLSFDDGKDACLSNNASVYWHNPADRIIIVKVPYRHAQYLKAKARLSGTSPGREIARIVNEEVYRQQHPMGVAGNVYSPISSTRRRYLGPARLILALRRSHN